MARRKKYEQNENLDRWLLSYADFITLLFATFVVLYAVSQVGMAQFNLLETAIRDAFSSTKAAKQNIQTVYEEVEINSLTNSLVMEYVNSNYEKEAFSQIQKQIEKLKSDNILKDIDVKFEEEGLIISLSDVNALFIPASRQFNEQGRLTLSYIASLIGKYFVLHQIKVEVHTDNKPQAVSKSVNDWEFSALRASSVVNLFTEVFRFLPDNLIAVGYGASRPLYDSELPSVRNKNNRIVITVVRNSFKNNYNPQDSFLKFSKSEQQKLRAQQLQIIENFYEFANAKANLKLRIHNNINLNSTEIYKQEAQRLSKQK